MYLNQNHRILDCSVFIKKTHSAHVQLLSCRYPIMLYHFWQQISLENLLLLLFEFVVLRHPTTKLLAKHKEMSIFSQSMDTKVLTPVITPYWSSPSPPSSMLIYARHKREIGLKIWGINIELGGKGGISSHWSLFWGKNGSFANLFCRWVSEVPHILEW